MVETATFTGHHKGISFDKYITNLERAYTTQLRGDQDYIDSKKVKYLYDMIQIPHNQAVMTAKEQMLRLYRNDWNQACIYMSTRLDEIYGENKKMPATGSRRISSASSKNIFNDVDISDPTRMFTLESTDN